MNFDTMTKDEIVEFFSKMDGQSFDEFEREPAFKIAFDKFLDDDHPYSFAKVPEEVAKKLWVRMLIKYCLSSRMGVGFDLKKIKRWAPQFKRIWDVTPYKSFKDLLSHDICRYYPEVAEYMIMENVELNRRSPLPSTIVDLIENAEVLEYAANHSNNEEIRELAQKKTERLGITAIIKYGTDEEKLRLLNAESTKSDYKWSILTDPQNKEIVTDCDYVVNILKVEDDAEVFDNYRQFISDKKFTEIVKYRNENGIKLYRNIYEEYEEGAVPNERIWSYRVIGRDEVEI